jgi:hypothetical protein
VQFEYNAPGECCTDLFIQFGQDGPKPATWGLDNVVIDWSVDAVRGDLDLDGLLTGSDLDRLRSFGTAGVYMARADFNFDGVNNDQDQLYWIRQLKRTYVGDANLDQQFDSGDLVAVFTSGEYEDAIRGNSTWSTGDWNGDGDFDSTDLIAAFQDGGYGQGPRAAVMPVPEPFSVLTIFWRMLVGMFYRRRWCTTQ